MPEGFLISAAGAWIRKDPDALLWYGIALDTWLPDGATLQSIAWTVPAGLTKVNQMINAAPLTVGDRTYAANTVGLVRLSGGTHGSDYTCVLHFVTSTGDEDERSIVVKVRNR